MKILVVGSGGREHALVWKLSQSPKVSQVFAAPGNAGMDLQAQCVPLHVDDIKGLTDFALREDIGLVVIGPELPLSLGLSDAMEAEGLRVFGPLQFAANLESSKKFSKDFMLRHKIPTAAYQCFNNPEKAIDYINSKKEGPIVVKASGLAQGKGVTVAANKSEAIAAVNEALLDKRFGEAGGEVVIEDFIAGEEVSLLTFCDGKKLVPMPPVQDHKRIGEGDCGPNTGGMGAYSPVTVFTKEVARQVDQNIIQAVLNGFQKDKMDYRGCLYIGLMLPSTSSNYQGPQVIEFNARLGDPETEVLLPLLKSDLLEILLGCANGDLDPGLVQWHDGAAACVVMSSGGYPGKYETAIPIHGAIADESHEALVFHSGTKMHDGELVTNGGRVLTVCATGKNLKDALDKVYHRISHITFKNSYFRRDIGFRELTR